MNNEVFPAPVLILGVGNLLLSDEAVGVRIAEQLLKRNDIPSYVEIIDGGTAGHDLIDLIEKREKIIIIDAVDGGCEAGSIYRFTPQEIKNNPVYHMTSLHQLGILEILAFSQLFGHPPKETVIFGVQPQSIELKIGLSPLVETKIPQVVDLVIKEWQKYP